MRGNSEKTVGLASSGDPGQDPLSSAVDEYLGLVNHDAHTYQLGSGNTEKRIAVFRHIKVWSRDSQLEFLETVANIFMQPVILARKVLSHRKPSKKVILQGIDGFIHEGEILLVLGRPGSGCTTLLKTLAGSTETYHGWSGIVCYFGLPVSILREHYRGVLVYNAEGDVHFPYLTVLRTLSFAVKTKTPPSDMNHSQRRRKIDVVTNALLKIFGLEATRTTMLGNEFINGVSGGERKWVSLAEVMSTNAKISLWDNSTQGLDATTSLRFGKALQTYVKSGHNIAIAALSPFSTKDDKYSLVPLLRLKNFSKAWAFVWSDRQSLSEFLISVTDPSVRVTKEGWEQKVPRTVEDWERCWRDSACYMRLQKALDGQFNTGHEVIEAKEGSPLASYAQLRRRNPYVLSWAAQLTTTLQRAFIRLAGDKPFLGASIIGPTFISLIFGSAFYNSADNTTGFFSRQGVLFFSLLFNSVQTMVEISSQFAQRPIVKKQSGFAMYHASIDAIASLISIYPLKLIGVSLFNIVLYFMANLKREPAAFFVFELFTYTMVLIMASLFRLIAALTKHEAIATSIGGVFILPLVIYTGYIIPKPSMHPWFKWITYINPLSYAFEGLMANEFHDRLVPCSHMVPSGPAYPNISPQNQVCPVTGATPGSSVVSRDHYIDASFEYTYSHLWRNYGILLAFFVGLVVAYGLVVEFVPQVEKGRGDVLIFLRRKKHTALEKNPPLPSGVTPTTSRLPTLNDLPIARVEQECFTWDKLEYQIPIRGGAKTLLTDIQGYVKPGTMTALMGESGAGKTTLLNVLAQRIHFGSVHGSIMMNGLRPDFNFARTTGYVESQDVHLSEFTVRATLSFSAQLRQPQHISDEVKNEYVEEIIEMLDMGEFADAVVGVPGSGLSLEQRKRMTVGVELVAKPSLLFLDEPTSGLDSQSSFAIVKCLRKLANSGQALICTIHQPSSALFEQFDRLLLLQKGGRCVYFGDIGSNSKTVISYFEGNGARKCVAKTNAGEYVLTATEAKDRKNWADIWQKSNEAHIVEKEASPTTVKAHKSRGKDTTSYLHQYRLVQRRSFQWYWRSPVYIRGKIILNIVAGLFLGFTFYQQNNSAQGLQNKMFATFASVILSAPLMNQLQPRFFKVRALFVSREEPARMYHWSIFIFTTVITEITANLLTGTLFFLPWYFVVGFENDMVNAPSRGIYQWILFLMFETWLSTFGQLLAAIAPTEQTAPLFIPMLFVFVALFCGVLQPLSQLPLFWHWVHYASPFTWLIDGLFSNILHLTTVTCSPSEINIFQPPANKTCGSFIAPFLTYGAGAIYNPSATKDCEYCRYGTGDEYLGTLDMSWGGRWRNFGVLWVYVVFNVGALLLVTGIPRWVRGWRGARVGAGNG
ncbi:uncharacterized protein LY89DRAFT_777066 [Mollisia scopiformis]|uniref:ABC transporter domain-containing protein n=1 Tax=Mollisia scopiformis TaxID=149040 RepID=A0A194XUA3_MOLSC|nr:uncharacterized protein LY89DRAFT_777066 [Mollisia scopiformis]KUJ23287.1 hypothetical protein LY89DRAFT_777066 [Mollisia scopiformis]